MITVSVSRTAARSYISISQDGTSLPDHRKQHHTKVKLHPELILGRSERHSDRILLAVSSFLSGEC
jgi:hypothetical protein